MFLCSPVPVRALYDSENSIRIKKYIICCDMAKYNIQHDTVHDTPNSGIIAMC